MDGEVLASVGASLVGPPPDPPCKIKYCRRRLSSRMGCRAAAAGSQGGKGARPLGRYCLLHACV
jgi:hypothetical protein